MNNERIAKELLKIARQITASQDEYDDRTVSITIETGNAAFQDGNRSFELARILRELADNIEDGRTGNITLMDFNGNKVGKATDI